MAARDPLDEAVLRELVGPRWSRVSVVDEVGSTNSELLADASAPDRSVLVAELQTAGRGRLDRSWSSPRGAGLTFSVLVRPDVAMQHWGWLPLLTGVALAEAISGSTAVPVTLKWPNDLLAGAEGSKLGGILAQSSGDAVVIGVGLNVSTRAEELPVAGATSLELCGAGEPDRTAVLAALLTRLDARMAQWADVDGDAEACGLAHAYRELCSTIGQQVAVSTGTGVIRGRAADVDAAGRLLVDTGAERVPLSAGDVEHVRPD